MNKLINQFKVRSGLYQLKLIVNKISRSGYSVPLDQAKSIGILFNITTEAEFKEVENLTESLKSRQRNIRLMGFISDKTLKINSKSDIQILTIEDISWNYIPKKEKIIQFINQEFDILINLCTEICIPLSIVSALSKSIFKVGAFQNNQIAIFDFSLITQQKSITGFSTELKYYLDKIR